MAKAVVQKVDRRLLLDLLIPNNKRLRFCSALLMSLAISASLKVLPSGQRAAREEAGP
jgi:hypothetical protein